MATPPPGKRRLPTNRLPLVRVSVLPRHLEQLIALQDQYGGASRAQIVRMLLDGRIQIAPRSAANQG